MADTVIDKNVTVSESEEPPEPNIKVAAAAVTAKPGEVTPKAPRLPPPPAKNPATFRQKVWLVLLLILVTALTLWLAKIAVTRVDGFIQRVNRIQWQAPANITLKPGPSNFWYDPDRHELVHIGVIDDKKKLDLINLLSTDPEGPVSADVKSYWSAVDHLAFVSNDEIEGLVINLIFLGGLAGVLGVQLRSLVNYIGHACYLDNLDIVIWWPYYALRPFIGLLLGMTVVVIIHAGFLAAGSGAPTGTLWWASVAFLAGFGEQEFTQRLRQLAKTLFGEKS